MDAHRRSRRLGATMALLVAAASAGCASLSSPQPAIDCSCSSRGKDCPSTCTFVNDPQAGDHTDVPLDYWATGEEKAPWLPYDGPRRLPDTRPPCCCAPAPCCVPGPDNRGLTPPARHEGNCFVA